MLFSRFIPAVLSALLLAAAGCGASRDVLTPSDGDAEALPGGSRSASAVTYSIDGSEYYNSRFAVKQGSSAVLTSSKTQEAFARYRIGPVAAGELPTSFTVDVSGTHPYWIGYVDWATGKWVWTSRVYGDTTLPVLSPSGALSGGRLFYVDIRTPVRYRVTVHSISITTEGQTPPPIEPPDMHVAKWRGNAAAAVSLTFDDSTKDHWSLGLPLWDEYGYDVTLGIMTSRFTDEPSRWPQLQQAVDAGHELANHTHTHPDLTTLSPAQIGAEFDTCTQLIQQHVPGYLVHTAIYPYTLTNATVREQVFQRFVMARGGDHGIADTTPTNSWEDPDYGDLLSYAPLNVLPMWQWNGTIDDVLFRGNWLIEQCHGIGSEEDPDSGWSPRPVAEFREHYDYIESFGSRIWVDTMANVGRYIKQRNGAQFEVIAANEGWVEFKVVDGLSNAAYDVPLTVQVERIANWDEVAITQDGVPLEFITTQDGRWQFDALPDVASVRIEKL